MKMFSIITAILFVLISMNASLALDDKAADTHDAPSGTVNPQPETSAQKDISAAAPPPEQTIPIGETRSKDENSSVTPLSQGKNSITGTGDLVLTVGDFLAFKSFSGDQDDYYLHEDPSYTKFSFNPSLKISLEVFLYKGLALGGMMNFDFNHYTDTIIDNDYYETVVDDFSFEAGPSLYYYLNFFNQYIPYIGFNFLFSQRGIQLDVQNQADSYISYKVNYFDYQGSLGFMFVIKKYFGIFINYTFTARMSDINDLRMKGPFSDSQYMSIHYYENKDIWGYCHTLSIGFKVFFDIR